MQGWGAWDADWTWSLALFVVTITLHASGVVFIAKAIERINVKVITIGQLLRENSWTTVVVIVAVAVALVVLHTIECFLWAYAYLHLGALPTPADAVLYSVDSMTTRGASGLVLEEHWRMMGAAEAGDGMLLFGVSTAFLFYVMQRIWKAEAR